MTHEQLAADLKFMFPAAVEESTVFRNELTVRVKHESIKDICTYLKSEHGFNYCADICGADRFSEEQRFEVIYNLINLNTNLRLRLKVFVEENASVPSVVSIWSSADWNERETYDMYGIVFEGHPDLRRMYMPEDFEYFPLRKDYPLIGVPGSIPLPEIDPKAQGKNAGERFNKGESV